MYTHLLLIPTDNDFVVFFDQKVEGIRSVLSTVEGTINSYGWSNTADPAQTEKLQEAVEKAGENFLK